MRRVRSIQAFNNGDAAAVAVLFNWPRLLYDTGSIYGREPIEKYHAVLFKEFHFSNYLNKRDQYCPHLRCARERHGKLAVWSLPAASFIAAFVLALLNRILEPPDSPRGSVLAVVGCIPMIPGSLAAKGLMNLFELLKASPGEGLLAATAAVENLMLVVFYPSRSRNSAGNSTPSVPSRAKAKQ